MVDHILVGNLLTTAFFSAWAWVGSLATDNYSFIDRLWSLLPPFYCLWVSQEFLGLLKLPDLMLLWSQYPKLAIMCILPLLWGTRLTYNFARKGGYSGGEDYRWAWLRKQTILSNPVLFQFFNLVFISTYQTFLLQLLTHPMYLVVRALQLDPSNSIGKMCWVDYCLVALFLLFLLVETLADEQQNAFYTLRGCAIRRELPPKTSYSYAGYHFSRHELSFGFNTKYFFAYSRHPNFVSEISLWFIYASFARQYVHLPETIGHNLQLYRSLDSIWNNSACFFTAVHDFYCHPITTYLGATLLWLIFLGSTPLTEHISSSKYSDYRLYQRAVPRLVPNPITVLEDLIEETFGPLGHR